VDKFESFPRLFRHGLAWGIAVKTCRWLRSLPDRDAFGSIEPGDARSKDPRPCTGVSLFIWAVVSGKLPKNAMTRRAGEE
jgi:hypothetical protein